MTPDTYTNQELFIEVGDGHELYVHDWGKADAPMPIISLHGGPGSNSKNAYRTSYSPNEQRVIFFDQRGCGRSLPYGSLEHNTTHDLIEDITRIADRLHLKQFILHGGSWGSCLALAYGIVYPERVKAMVLNGIFTGSQSEIDWISKGSFETFYPEVWQEYLSQTPKAYWHNPTAYHSARTLEDTGEPSKKSAYLWSCLEGNIASLDDRFVPKEYDTFDPAGTRIEALYMANRCFMPDRHIIKHAHKLTMPVYLLQGRYDMVCPPRTAYELNQKLPNGKLFWTTGGHAPERETWNTTRALLSALTA